MYCFVLQVELYVELNQNLRKAITDSHAKLSSVKALIETSNGADINTKSKKRKDTTVSIEWTSTNRTEISLAQSSLICIDILSKHLGKFKKNTSELCDTFKELWEFLVVINSIITLDLGKRTSENRTIFKIVEEVIKLGGSLFLCIGSICKSLGAEILTNLEVSLHTNIIPCDNIYFAICCCVGAHVYHIVVHAVPNNSNFGRTFCRNQ